MSDNQLFLLRTITKRFKLLIAGLLILSVTGCSSDSRSPAPQDTAATITADKPLAMQSADHTLQNNNLEIHFLDVGQGLSVFAQSNGRTMLYDGGDREYSSYVVSYLKDQGVESLDYIIASHYDADHLNGLVGAMNAFSIGTIIGPDYVHTSRVYDSFISRAGELGKKVEHPQPGTEYTLGDARITILSPQTIVSNSNNNSIAIKIQNGEDVILIMGDAEHAEEADILASGIDLDCAVLVLGHHGSASSTTWDLLQNTVPEYAVISCGRDNPYGHPHAETMEKLESMDIDMFRTDLQGTITAVSDGRSLVWNEPPSADYTAGNEATSQPTAEFNHVSQMVWKSATGSKYHSIPDCGSMNPDKATEITLDYAEAIGLGRCKNCWR